MAASSRISYNAASQTGGAHLAAAARYTILAQQEIARAKALADSITGGGATPANLESSSEFNAATGGGAALYTAIANLAANINTTPVSALAALDQG